MQGQGVVLTVTVGDSDADLLKTGKKPVSKNTQMRDSKNMKSLRYLITLSSLAFMLSYTTNLFAWLRPVYEDETVVKTAELIVIGHLEIDSIKYVPHNNPISGRSWEHHAVLSIAEVLKGDLKEKEIPIIIHYGLDPVVGGYWEYDGSMVNLRGDRQDYPKDIIEIIDTGSSGSSLEPLVKDAGKDNIWFLCRKSASSEEISGNNNFGIAAPEFLQALELKEYILAYLTDNPEKNIRELTKNNKLIPESGKRYLAHKEVERILLVEDNEERVRALLPYFSRKTWWGQDNEANKVNQGIIDCGKTAGKYLREMFDDPNYADLRENVLELMGKCGDLENIPFIIHLLEKQSELWSDEEANIRWDKRESEPGDSEKKDKSYWLIYRSVEALANLSAAEAVEVVNKIKKTFEKVDKDIGVVNICNSFLEKFANKE